MGGICGSGPEKADKSVLEPTKNKNVSGLQIFNY